MKTAWVAKLCLGVCLLVLTASPVRAAEEWSQVKEIRMIGDYACVWLTDGPIFKLDLDTNAGRARFQVALAAHSTGKSLYVYISASNVEGGCWKGQTTDIVDVMFLLDD